jgi:sarcosine oxidase
MAGERFDVAVVGLGAAGSAALLALARRGARVVGIDRHAPPHDRGSSHGGSRITRLGIGEGTAYTPLAMRSHALWAQLEAETGRRLFTRCGLLVIAPPGAGPEARGARFLATTRATAERHGVAHEMLDAAAAARRFPQFLLEPGAAAYFEPGAGWLDPEACVAAQIGGAVALGATALTGRRVQAVTDTGTGVRIETDTGPVEAGAAVVAAGAWTGALMGGPFTRLLRPERQVQHFFPLTPDAPRAWRSGPVFIRAHGDGTDFSYGFPPLDGAGMVKLGSHNDGPALDPEAGLAPATPQEAAAVFETYIDGRMAGVGPVAARSVPCFYTMTPDGDFIVDHAPGLPRVLVVSACSGHGFKHAPAIGEAAAETLLDGAPARVDLGAFRLARFG